MEIFQYSFMQKAFLVGILVGTLCPTVGMFLVLRRLSMVGDTLAHTSLAGVLLGILWGLSPLPLALLISALVSLGLERLRALFRYYGELSLAVVMAGSLGLSVILMGLTRTSDASLSGILFGSIITLTTNDLLLIAGLALLVWLVVWRSYRGLFYLTFDEEGARINGIPTTGLSYILILLAAAVIAIGLRIVGALLVSSLMIIPVAAALLLQRGFKQTLLWSNLFGITAVLVGLTASFYLDLAPGGTIVVTSILLLLGILALRPLLFRRPEGGLR